MTLCPLYNQTVTSVLKRCKRREYEDGNWHTLCGNIFVLIDGGPSDNHMAYCPYCTGIISEYPFENSSQYLDKEED